MKTIPALQRPDKGYGADKKNSLLSFALKILVALCLLITALTIAASAQCTAPSLTFHDPVLISGTDKQVGAIYNFAEVIPGVDAHIEILDLVGGASLAEIDNTTGAGYYDAFQPYVTAPANSTSYLDWKITFKVAGSNTDTTLACLAVTGIDVDGDNNALQEFVEAATPGSFAVDPYTNLQISFDGVRSRAVGQITTIPLIDTAHREAMFQMNFNNINTLEYRNGAISNYGSDEIRQTCIYFKPFFTAFTLLPVKLISFNAQPKGNMVNINWTATTEQDTKSYTVQRSTDGKSWKDVTTVNTKNGPLNNNYFVTDETMSQGIVYYRLKQTDYKAFSTYSYIIKVNTSAAAAASITINTLVNNAIILQVNAITNDVYTVELYAASGIKINSSKTNIVTGNNYSKIDMPAGLPAGVYIVSIKNNKGASLYTTKIFKSQSAPSNP
jgi:hypothetical protein